MSPTGHHPVRAACRSRCSQGRGITSARRTYGSLSRPFGYLEALLTTCIVTRVPNARPLPLGLLK